MALPPVEVSDVQIEQQSLSFSVDQVGVPVLVKVSYFPNWEVAGALGPYRIGPNMMVVVPTADHVEMTYGRSGADWLFTLLTVAGIALCIFWRVRGDVRHAADVPVFGPTRRAGRDADRRCSRPSGIDHDPWAPDRFEPHGIAEEDRWIRPRPAPPPTAADRAGRPRSPSTGREPNRTHLVDRPDDPTR